MSLENISNQIDQLDTQIKQLKELASDDAELQQLAQEEIKQLEIQKKHLAAIIDSQSETTSDESDGPTFNPKIAIIEIRPAAGGEEAKIWAQDLLRMYVRYAQNHDWQMTPFDDMVIKFKGNNCYPLLQYEAGVHRVQRVPATESQGRIHTSTATVAVLPEIKPTQVQLEDKDIEFVAYTKSSGAGGQNVNKVATAVRLTHTPTGLNVDVSSERTQNANRQIAMDMLASKLWEKQEQERLDKLESARESIGRGMRAEKIRTYNYPQNRVTDHRINESWHKLETIMEGDLDDILKSLKDYTQQPESSPQTEESETPS